MVRGGSARILACFQASDTRNFVELCRLAGFPTDLGGHYIRQLLTNGYITKVGRGQYKISVKGKTVLATSLGQHKNASRPRLIVLLVAKQNDAYLLMRRSIQPFMNRLEWPSGSVGGNEPLPLAASRILHERIGVSSGQPKLSGFFRRIDIYEDRLFDDKLFAVHTHDLPSGVEIGQVAAATGDILLCQERALSTLPLPSRALLDILAFTKSSASDFRELTYNLEETDFMSDMNDNS